MAMDKTRLASAIVSNLQAAGKLSADADIPTVTAQWLPIADAIIAEITAHAAVTVATGIAVATTGSATAQTGATTAPGTGTVA